MTLRHHENRRSMQQTIASTLIDAVVLPLKEGLA